jgi:hypothetical protein
MRLMQRIAQQLYSNAETAFDRVIETIGQQGVQLPANDPALKPHQAELRRAVSTAYYAVFHAIIEASVDRIAADAPPSVQAALARSFDHSTMKQFARSLATGQPPQVLKDVFAEIPDELKNLLELFTLLQGERHVADYDLSRPFDFFRANRAMEMMWLVFDSLRIHKQKPIPEIDDFLTLLPVSGRLRSR